MSSEPETTPQGHFGKDRSALAGFGEALLDTLADHTTDARWSEWLQAPFESAAVAGDVPLATALFKAGVAGAHLHPAIRADHGQLVEELLRLGASPTAKDEHGDAPIHLAASLGRADIIKTLEKGKAMGEDEIEEDGKGRTPLHLACWKGNVLAVQALLDTCTSRADFRRRLGKTSIGFTPFDLAVRSNHVGVKEALLARWPNESASKSLKMTDGAILHMALQQNNVPMIEFLVVEAGTDVNFKDSRGFPPLHIAAQKGASQAMSALIKHGADTGAVDDTEGMTPLQHAAMGGHVAAIDVLCAAGVDLHLRVESYIGYDPESDTWSALDFAAVGGSVDAVKALVGHGADWKTLSREGMTALNTAAGGNRPEVIDLLIELGAAVDGPHDGLPRPLYSAVACGSPDALHALLRHGADLQATHSNETMVEVALTWQQHDVVKIMLENGVDPNFVCAEGISLLERVFAEMLSVDVFSVLVQGGADIGLPNHDGTYPIHEAARLFEGPTAVELLIEAGADVNVETITGLTPLQIACKNNNGLAVAALLRHGASIDVVDEAGLPPLINACGVTDGFAVEALLRHGASIDVTDEQGLTPLQIACDKSDGYAVAALLGHGSSIDVVDEEGKSVLHLAAVAEARRGTWRACGYSRDTNPPSRVDTLLRAGADETRVDSNNLTPADRVALEVSLESDFEETAKLVLEQLARAPQDRAWRRRALWVMSRALPDKVQLGLEAMEVDEGAAASSDGGGEGSGDELDGGGDEDVKRVAARVLDLQEGIFRNVVIFL